jgi:hypothetical protein
MRVATSVLTPLRPLNHCSNRLRVEWLATLVSVTCFLHPGADFTVAQAAGFAFRRPKVTRFCDHLRVVF